jgi:hypothetical protein
MKPHIRKTRSDEGPYMWECKSHRSEQFPHTWYGVTPKKAYGLWDYWQRTVVLPAIVAYKRRETARVLGSVSSGWFL